jgi:hypothetical protein
MLTSLCLALAGWLGAAPADAPREVSKPLPAAALVDGVPCAAGRAEFFEAGGRLASCRLSRDASVHGASLPAGSTVALRPDGRLRFVFLPGVATVDGHRCRGGGHDWMTTFHDNGRVETCWLAQDETIGGVPCARATIWRDLVGGGASARFRADGSLESCRLAARHGTAKAGERFGAAR